MPKALPRFSFAVGLLLLFLAPPLQTQAPRTTTYRSQAMGLTLTYPASFKAAGTKQKPADAETLGHDCSAMPLAVMDMTTGFNMIFLKRIDTSCLGIHPNIAQLEDITSATLGDTLRKLGNPEIGPGVPFSFGTHDATVLSGTVKVPQSRGNNLILGIAACITDGKNIACFQFLSNDCEAVGKLAGATVTFDGEAAVPVVPKSLMAPCYP
jgi:hypothetical protein